MLFCVNKDQLLALISAKSYG